jgi:hypothetical protein
MIQRLSCILCVRACIKYAYVEIRQTAEPIRHRLLAETLARRLNLEVVDAEHGSLPR